MKTTISSLSPPQLNVLVILRLLIGWHFLYEGAVKLYSSSWSAAGYLDDSQGLFATAFLYVFPTSHILGLDRLMQRYGQQTKQSSPEEVAA